MASNLWGNGFGAERREPHMDPLPKRGSAWQAVAQSALFASAGGSLSGSISIASTATSTLSGIGGLSASSGISSTVSGTLSGVGQLSGAAETSSAASGSLSGAIAASGSISITSTVSGALTGQGALSSTASITSAVSGVLTGQAAASGTIGISSAASASLTGVGAASGTITASTTIAASLTGLGNLVGASGISSGVSGTLTFVPSGFAFVGANTAVGQTISIPAHQVGDMIMIFAYKALSSAVTVPTMSPEPEWQVLTATGAANNNSAVGWRIATGSDMTSGTWSNADALLAVVYRGPKAIGSRIVTSQQSAQLVYSGISPLVQTAGTSWIAAFVGHQTATDVETPPSGMINRVSSGTATKEVALHDSNGTRTGWTQQLVPVNANSGYRTQVVELHDGIGLISGSVVSTLSITGGITGISPVSGSVQINSAISGVATAALQASGSIAVASTVSGTLSGVGALSGACAAGSSVIGSATGIGDLLGSILPISALTGALQGIAYISGSIVCASFVYGQIVDGRIKLPKGRFTISAPEDRGYASPAQIRTVRPSSESRTKS